MSTRLLQRGILLAGVLAGCVLLGLLLIVMLFPLYWMVMTSFKPASEVVTNPPLLFPRQFAGLENYREVIRRVPVAQFYGNSLYIAAARTLGTLFTCSLAGYIFAKFDFFAKRVLFIGLLATMMVPSSVTLVPYFILFKDLGLLDTYWAVIVPGLASASGIFLVRQFMETIPNELISAARIDGCGEFRIYAQIVMPLCKPVLSVLAVFAFMNSWNDFLWPMLVLRQKGLLTLPVGLILFVSLSAKEQWANLAMAFSTMMVLPIVLIFLLAQRQFVEGIALTGLR